MIQHNLTQGTPEWLAHRSKYFNASDAPAMMGVSSYKTRQQLLKEMATGITPDVDSYTQRIFDDGHRFEALAREMAEQIIEDNFYPTVGTKGNLSASFDGLTMMDDITFEHKTLNDKLRQCATVNDLPAMYKIQMEQQLHVADADKCLFMASKWQDETLLEEKHFWYKPNLTLRAEILAGWEQFAKDLENYQHVEVVEPPKAEQIKDLPMVTVQVKGELTLCNLDDVRPLFDNFLANALTVLTTDEDFVQAEAEAKMGRETAKRCKLTAKAVVDQMLSIGEVTRTLEEYAAKFDALALKQEKLVKSQKELIKAEIMSKARIVWVNHKNQLVDEIKPIRLDVDEPDFAGAMKNKRTLASLHDAVDTELANAKIKADAWAREIRAKLTWYNDYVTATRFLFTDLSNIIISNSLEAFQSIVKSRIAEYTLEQEKKAELERQRIQAEEQRKAEAQQALKLEQERAEIRRQERIKAEEEAAKIRAEELLIAEIEAKIKSAKDAVIEAKRQKDFDRQAQMNHERANAIAEQELLARRAEGEFIAAEQASFLKKAFGEAIVEEVISAVEMVTIPKSEYLALLKAKKKLDALEEFGVDDWMLYHEIEVDEI